MAIRDDHTYDEDEIRYLLRPKGRQKPISQSTLDRHIANGLVPCHAGRARFWPGIDVKNWLQGNRKLKDEYGDD